MTKKLVKHIINYNSQLKEFIHDFLTSRTAMAIPNIYGYLDKKLDSIEKK